jgi:hypothetical protein
MDTYILPTITAGKFTDLEKGVFLVVLHAGRIPPHIGLVADGLYHSLSIKGRDLNVPLEVLTKSVLQRKIPSLFIQIKTGSELLPEVLGAAFQTDVQRYHRVDIGVATCLSPLKHFFARTWKLDLTQVNYLYQLLPLLEKQELLGCSYGWNMEALLQEGSFRLPYYTMTEINKGITGVRTEYS